MIDPKVKEEIAEEVAETSEIMTLLGAHVIESQADYDRAGDLVTGIKERWKYLEEKRTRVTQPLNAVIREVNSWFAPAQKPLEKAEAELKRQLTEYTVRTREANRVAMLAVADKVASGEAPSTELMRSLTPIEQASNISVREYWDFEIVEPNAVAAKYCSPDPELIAKAREEYLGRRGSPSVSPPPIDGVRFFLTGSVAVRGKK